MKDRTSRATLMVGTVLAALLAVPAAAPAADQAQKQILIENVDVWDGVSDGLQKGTNVLVEGNLINQEGRLGVIALGAYADLVLVEGNPLEDVTTLSNPGANLKLIMKDGVIYKNTLDRQG